jgi:hypothetical protein
MTLTTRTLALAVCAAGCSASGAPAIDSGAPVDLLGGGPVDLLGGSFDAALDFALAPDLALVDGATASWWRPGTGALPWQWELSHEIDVNSASDLGTGGTTYNGASAAAPVVYDIDGFDNTASDVAALHALGKKVICYIEVGALEAARSDAAKFPAAAQGNTVPNYPDEKYLDIKNSTVVDNIKARIDMCKQKGFDGIEPDIDDSYTDSTGFTISESDNVAYLTTLSSYARSLGLAWGLKNGGDGGAPAQFIPDVLPLVDFAVVEEPFFLKTIGLFEPMFDSAGKPLFVAEYTNDTSSAGAFCPQALAAHVNAALFSVNLDASLRTPCQ